MKHSDPKAMLDCAHRLFASGDVEAALSMFLQASAIPGCRHDALAGAARCHMALGNPRDAVELLQDACSTAQAPPVSRRNLGIAHIALRQFDAAIEVLSGIGVDDPAPELTLLHLGRAQHGAGMRLAAAQTFFRALNSAQKKGEWLDASTTPPHLKNLVIAAMNHVDVTQTDVLLPLLDPVARRHPSGALARVERWLHAYLKRKLPETGDPLQKARFLYLPEISTEVIYKNDHFPWIASLESTLQEVRAEAIDQCLARSSQMVPFLTFQQNDDPSRYLGGDQARWDAFFFYRDGTRHDTAHATCPATSRALANVPLVRISGHAPEICYSILGPGTHILPHTGVTNTRLVVHLPLVVPHDCALRVREKTHVWREGEIVVFDDTYLHEAWNRSDAPRIVLLMDTWNPNLTTAEREALAALVEGIGEFNRG